MVQLWGWDSMGSHVSLGSPRHQLWPRAEGESEIPTVQVQLFLNKDTEGRYVTLEIVQLNPST